MTKGPAPCADPQGDEKFFVGDWRVGGQGKPDGIISLGGDWKAKSSTTKSTGRWEYVHGECRIIWSNGTGHIIRREWAGFRALYFKPGTSFTDSPTGTTTAEKTAP